MGRKKIAAEDSLVHDIKTRVTGADFRRLNGLLEQSRFRNMSELLRDIVCNKPITVYTKDGNLGFIMEELTKIRKELNAIGNNFNQVTRHINSLPENTGKSILIVQASEIFREVDAQVKLLYPIITQLAKKWLQG
jgi:hypothetical protein